MKKLPKPAHSKRAQAYFSLLVATVFWGWAGPVVKYTLSFADSVTFLFHRFWLVSLIFLPFFIRAIKKNPQSNFKDLFWLTMIGFLGGPLCLLLIFAGTDLTTALDASLIVAMAPIFVVLASLVFLKEEVTGQEKVGLFIALVGTLITILGPLAEGSLFAVERLKGNLLIMLSNLAWAGYIVFIKKYTSRYSALIITPLTFLAGLIVLTPLFIFRTPVSFWPDSRALPGIGYMALFSSVFAYTAYNHGVALIEASEATMFSYLQPVFAAPLAFFWLEETITTHFLTGAIVIAFGVYLTEKRSPLFRKR